MRPENPSSAVSDKRNVEVVISRRCPESWDYMLEMPNGLRITGNWRTNKRFFSASNQICPERMWLFENEAEGEQDFVGLQEFDVNERIIFAAE